MLSMQKEDLSHYELPDSPGVYLFWNKKELLYVGKATSLKDRTKSYFSHDLLQSRGERIKGMIESATALTWQATDSVLEALISEANLIKKHQPPFNVLEKDNKSFNYLVITKERYPRVLVVRGRELFQQWNDKDIKHLFGPFPQGGSLKEALKLVRKIFPYRDSCTPESEKPCFNRQIGLCPGVCEGSMNAQEYAKSIKNIVTLFSGRKKTLVRQLEKEVKARSRQERFEEAARANRQVHALTHIQDVALIRGDAFSSRGGEVKGIRIESYDIAHTAGMETVGVMTVVEDGVAKKSDYRMFKIRGVGNNDTKALAQVFERRLAHHEWPLARLLVIDGGKGQLNAIRRVMNAVGVDIPCVAVVKDERHKPRDIIGDRAFRASHEKEILLANAEAHRFAQRFHDKRRRRALTKKIKRNIA